MTNSTIASIFKLVVTVIKPDTYRTTIVDNQKENEFNPLILSDNGDVRLDYDNDKVRQNIYDEMKKYENFDLKARENVNLKDGK